jgi:hypothetical protein
MTWKLLEISFPFNIGDGVTRQVPGTTWRVPLSFKVPHNKEGLTIGEANEPLLSPEFKASGRDFLIFIKLPGTDFGWCPDYCYGGNEHGWSVTGSLPAISINPSVNHEGIYHGWVQNGELSDDIEERQYDEKGRRVVGWYE